MAEPSARPNALFIGEGVVFSGSISAPGNVTVSGTVSGQLTANDLQIGKTGKVSGQIEARDINVHGELNETIISKEHILIHSTGQVNGKLQYKEIEIARGGKFSGDMTQAG